MKINQDQGVELTQIECLQYDGQVYVMRASRGGEPVWIESREKIEQLTPIAIWRLIRFRLAWDEQHTRVKM